MIPKSNALRQYETYKNSVHPRTTRTVTTGRVACCPMVSHVVYAPMGQTDRQTDGRTDGRQTVTLRFLLSAACIKMDKDAINRHLPQYRAKSVKLWLFYKRLKEKPVMNGQCLIFR